MLPSLSEDLCAEPSAAIFGAIINGCGHCSGGCQCCSRWRRSGCERSEVWAAPWLFHGPLPAQAVCLLPQLFRQPMACAEPTPGKLGTVGPVHRDAVCPAHASVCICTKALWWRSVAALEKFGCFGTLPAFPHQLSQRVGYSHDFAMLQRPLAWQLPGSWNILTAPAAYHWKAE